MKKSQFLLHSTFSKSIGLFLCSIITSLSMAQPGSIDLPFNPNDVFGDGAHFLVHTTAIQKDEKIIIGGEFTQYNGTSRNGIARLNTDGTLDVSFSVGTGVTNGFVRTTAIQNDGKIIMGGGFTSYNGIPTNRIARLNVDGTLDNSFTVGSGANAEVRTIAIQSDGKIIMGGDFTSYDGIARNGIARLNVDGTLDSSFTVGSGVNNSIQTIAIQSDGKIIIGGKFTSFNETTMNRIARLDTDGTLDDSFTVGTGANSFVYSVAIQSDGKIIVGGGFTSFNGIVRSRIGRLNTDGTVDSSFTIGTGPNIIVYTISIQNDEKIIVGGFFTSYNGISRRCIVRLNADGTLEDVFNLRSGARSTVLTTAIQSDGKIIIGGHFKSYNGTSRNYIARINTDGTLDDSFIEGTGAIYEVYASAIQSDGKIVIGGNFTSYNGTEIYRIARLNADGSLDSSFTSGVGASNTVFTISIQSDGKIIIGGNFTSYNGTEINRIARLNTDGTLDNTFNVGSGADYIVRTTSIQTDGKIIIGGQFSNYNETQIKFIARLNSDGILDDSFASIEVNFNVQATAIQNDGKIIIGGDFTFYDGTVIERIARLNINGTFDDSFIVGVGANESIETTAIQSDGKIIIGGEFTSYDGKSANHIARLNTNGTIDDSFAGTGANDDVLAVTIQTDEKIIIGGDFTSYNGTARNYIARLNIDGTLDSSFTLGSGTDNTVFTTSIQNDEKIIIGGDFTSYNGTGRNRVARVIGRECVSLAEPSAIVGHTTACQGIPLPYSVTNVPGVIYNWTLPVSWTGYSTTNSISAIAGTSGGTIYVEVNNACSSKEQTLEVTVNDIPSTPEIISGLAEICNNSSSTYSIGEIPGATSYNWTLPNDWTGNSSTNSIDATVVNGGTITVTADNGCGISSEQRFEVTVIEFLQHQQQFLDQLKFVMPHQILIQSIKFQELLLIVGHYQMVGLGVLPPIALVPL